MYGRAAVISRLVPRQLRSVADFYRPLTPVYRRSFNSYPVRSAADAADLSNLELTPEAVKTAFQPELAALNTHCMLLNQTNASQLLALTDVVPLMQIYSSLVSNKVGHLAVRKVSQALRQTAKDSSFVLRTLPQSERSEQLVVLFGKLRDALNEVAGSIAKQDVLQASGFDRVTLSNLFRAYEIVDPFSGVRFYRSMHPMAQSVCGSFVIPCMVKSRQPFTEVNEAFARDASPNTRAAATMAWACLRYGEIKAAQVLFEQVISDDARTESDYVFLIDAFVGDAPADLALSVFRKHSDHAPHHASVTRMLIRLWNQDLRIPEQIAVFREYLERLAVPSEMSIKTVATAVVGNVVSGSPNPDETLDHVLQLCRIYDTYVPRHTVFLNVILTELSNRWCSKRDEARDLVLAVIANYGPQDDDSVVSFRVRLNALENLSDTDAIVRDLWETRKSLTQLPSIQKWDWLALSRATNASAWFVQEWKGAGSPYERDVRRFCASRGYRIN